MKVFKWIEENLEEFIMCILLIAMACIMTVSYTHLALGFLIHVIG